MKKIKMPNVVVVGSDVEDLTFWNETLPGKGENKSLTASRQVRREKANQAVACYRQEIETF